MAHLLHWHKIPGRTANRGRSWPIVAHHRLFELTRLNSSIGDYPGIGNGSFCSGFNLDAGGNGDRGVGFVSDPDVSALDILGVLTEGCRSGGKFGFPESEVAEDLGDLGGPLAIGGGDIGELLTGGLDGAGHPQLVGRDPFFSDPHDFDRGEISGRERQGNEEERKERGQRRIHGR